MFRTVLTIVAISAVCHATEKTLEEGDVKVKVQGQSGKITFSRKGNSVTVNFDYIKELSQDGTEVGASGKKKHSINSFATQSFNFKTTGTQSLYQNLAVKHIQFEANITGPGAKLVVDIYIFKTSGSVKTSNNETLDVQKGTVKFNINLESWTFCGGAGDTCSKGGSSEIGTQVEFGIEVKSRSKPAKRSKKKGKGRKLETLDLGGADCTLSGAIKVDGVWREMAASYPKVESKGAKNLFIFRFPKFASRVDYDPTVDLSSGNPGLKVGILTLIASIFALIKILS